MANNFELAAFFLIPFAAIVWLWWGVRVWQVGVLGLVFGVAFGGTAALANYGTEFVLGSILGPGPEGWLARRLACSAGFCIAGLSVLLLTFLRRQQPRIDS
jgi:hypothetical protein